MDEKVKDFIPEKREVKLRSGLVVTIIAPTNRWWFEWLIPKQKSVQWSGVDAETKSQIIKEMKDGTITQETLGKMPLPLVELLIEFIMYHTKKDRDYMMDQMLIEDTILIIETWLQIVDIKRVISFFVKIKQMPISILLEGKKGAITA